MLNRIRRKLRRWLHSGGDGLSFGDLGGTEPISDQFGYDRGTPVDRYYIENFLDSRRADITGRTLEIGDDEYTAKFGGDRTSKREVLHVHAENPAATIVGDLSVPHTLPENAFDCAVITQTIHLIWDMQAAVEELKRGLKPGGVLLLTTPGITSVDRDEWGAGWYWSLTRQAVERMFGEVFGPENITVGCNGNVYAATAFLQGLALEEVDTDKLDVRDDAYPMIVTVRAVKAA